MDIFKCLDVTSDIEDTGVVDTSAYGISSCEEATNDVVIDVDASKGFGIFVKKSLKNHPQGWQVR